MENEHERNAVCLINEERERERERERETHINRSRMVMNGEVLVFDNVDKPFFFYLFFSLNFNL